MSDSTNSGLLFAILLLFPLALNLLGLHILHIARKTTDFHRIHYIILLNLSIASVMLAISSFMRKTIAFFFPEDVMALFLTDLALNALFYTFYIGILILIVLDRIALFHYGLLYTVIWTEQRVKMVIAGFAVFSFVMFVTFTFIYWDQKVQLISSIIVYLWPTLEYTFMVSIGLGVLYLSDNFSSSTKHRYRSSPC